MSSWRTDVAIMESLEIRIKRETDPRRRAIYETALEIMLESNAYLRPKTPAPSAPENL